MKIRRSLSLLIEIGLLWKLLISVHSLDNVCEAILNDHKIETLAAIWLCAVDNFWTVIFNRLLALFWRWFASMHDCVALKDLSCVLCAFVAMLSARAIVDGSISPSLVRRLDLPLTWIIPASCSLVPSWSLLVIVCREEMIFCGQWIVPGAPDVMRWLPWIQSWACEVTATHMDHVLLVVQFAKL